MLKYWREIAVAGRCGCLQNFLQCFAHALRIGRQNCGFQSGSFKIIFLLPSADNVILTKRTVLSAVGETALPQYHLIPDRGSNVGHFHV